MELILPNKIAVANILGKNRGLIAKSQIVRNELIERSPVILFHEEQTTVLMENNLDAYLWVWNDGETIEKTAIALGLISLCNHSRKPNCSINKRLDDLVIELIANQDIEEGEELTLKYISTDFDDE